MATQTERVIKKMFQKYGTIFEWYPLDEADDILMTTDFPDQDSIRNIVELADQEAWDYIREHRQKYPRRVQAIIDEFDPPVIANPRMKVVDYKEKPKGFRRQ